MTAARCPTYQATIFIAGDHDEAKRVCREFCDGVGLCVTVELTTYIYTGGAETGVRVGLINYPRFPSSTAEIRGKAFALADLLRERLAQDSWSVVTSDETFWNTFRQEGSEPADYLLGQEVTVSGDELAREGSALGTPPKGGAS